jgi:hypothetical protein
MRSLNTTNSLTCLFTAFILFNLPLQAQWIQQGPGPSKQGQVENITDREITGAVNCVTPHRTDANILYIGGTNGGVWRTTNATAASPSWTWISSDLPSQAIGALEFDPTDATNQTLVVGLGRTSSFFGFGTGNRGVFRTTTGTTPWTNIDPAGTLTNINITGLAARGATIIVSTPNGIFRTTNTGALWTQISGGAGTGLPAGNSRDLVADPNDNNVLYTNSGTSGIYRSADMGATWTKVSDAALDADLVGQGNVELAVGNSNNVFVAIVRAGRLGDVYRSPDGLGTWTSLDIPITTEGGVQFGIHPGGQGGTHLSLTADPTNANICYIGGDRQPGVDEGNPALPRWPNSVGAQDFSGRLFRINASLAAGSQVSPITNNGTAGSSSPHGDSRDMDFDANGDLIEGDDGGVYKQTSPIDATGNWFSLNGNSNVTEIHSIDWDKNSNIIISGVQDNGTPQQEFPTNNKWASVHTGDGGDVAVDDITSAATSTRYSSFQNFGNFRRRVYSSANAFVSQTFPALTNTATGVSLTGFSFVTPIKVNSQVGTRLIISSTNGIFESLDQGNTVTSVSASTATASGADAIAYGAADNVNILYVGSGAQVLIRDAAAPDALTASAAYAGGTVQGIALDPDDSQSAYVIDNDQVFETTNEGGAWADITGNLMTLTPGTLRTIAYIPNGTDDMLAVGTDFGVYIAAGPAFNVWSKLGTNLPPVMVLDLEYDRADGILLAGTLGRDAWTFNLSERDPVDIELVLDFSGSMLSPACGTCDTKLNVLKDAVEIFMKLWKGLAVTDDRIGLVYFRTNITKFSDAGATLLSVINKTDDMVADVRAQTSVPANLTALGGGLQSAINDLTTATRPRNVILFTDGMQNVNPGVVYPALTISNGVFSTNSNVTATTPATTLNAALGIKVNTIGVGATSAFETQLADIAAGTGGLTKITTAPDDELRRFFVEELVDALRASSPQLVAYRKGTVTTVTTETFSMNTSGMHVIFKVSYKRGNNIDVSIRKGSSDVTQFAKITRGAFYQIYSFPFERLLLLQGSTKFNGPWTVNMRAQNVAYEIAAIVDEASLKYDLSVGNFPYKAGQPLKLKAKVLVNGEPITDSVTVTARVSKPNQSLGTLLSTNPMPTNPGIAMEPNSPIGAQKLTLLSQNAAFYNQLKPVESGISLSADASRTFVADFTNTTTPGTYKVTYTIKGKHPFTGDFERVEERIVVVKFAGFDMTASDLVIRRDVTAGNVRWIWAFTPKDGSGNFLGPDYGSVIKVTSTNGNVQGVRDLGNGRYEIDVVAPTGVRPNIRISLYDEQWFDGLIPGTGGGGSGAGAGGLKKWYGSIHLGASIPLSPFSNSFGTQFYGKLDLEYRIAKALGIQVVAGINTFQSNLNVIFAGAQGKLYIPIGGKLSLTGEAGPGWYQFKGGNSYFGLDLGAGLDIPLNSGNRISFGVNYVTMNNHPGDAKWLTAGVGFHVGF